MTKDYSLDLRRPITDVIARAKCAIFESRSCSKVGGVSGKIEQPCPSGFYSLNGLLVFMDIEFAPENYWLLHRGILLWFRQTSFPPEFEKLKMQD